MQETIPAWAIDMLKRSFLKLETLPTYITFVRNHPEYSDILFTSSWDWIISQVMNSVGDIQYFSDVIDFMSVLLSLFLFLSFSKQEATVFIPCSNYKKCNKCCRFKSTYVNQIVREREELHRSCTTSWFTEEIQPCKAEKVFQQSM